MKKNQLEQYVLDTECYGDTKKSKGENIRLVIERIIFKTASMWEIRRGTVRRQKQQEFHLYLQHMDLEM